MIGVIDYGSGNFSSVYTALGTLTTELKIISHADDFTDTSHIILPGVGAFASALNKLRELNLIEELEHQIIELKKPYLGICVGMQILGGTGYEFGEHNGLGWIDADVRLLENEVLPHMGWNEVEAEGTFELFSDIQDKATFYFVHSYAMSDENIGTDTKMAFTEYEGKRFVCAVQKNNIHGVQFHPEKSQEYGLKLLSNFISS